VLQSYVAAQVMLQAIEAAKSPSAPDVRDALQSGRFKTIVGELAFRPGDQQALAPVWPAAVKPLTPDVAGAKFGFVATDRYEAADMLPEVAQTGCVPR
jgi:ABC-type branched-subunit amino acid transport system substrate-binding protein